MLAHISVSLNYDIFSFGGLIRDQSMYYIVNECLYLTEKVQKC